MKKRFFAFLTCLLTLAMFLLPVMGNAESLTPDVTTNLHLTMEDYPGDVGYVVRPSINNESIIFDATATNNDPASYPITYQWYKTNGNGYEIINGETFPTLTVSPVDNSAEGWYQCIIKDPYEEIEYNGHIVVQIGLCYGDMNETDGFGGFSTAMDVGNRLEWDMTCTNDGDSEITYQWYRKNSEGDYVALENETNAIFSIESVQLTDSGEYKVIVKDDNQQLEIPADLQVLYDTGLKFIEPTDDFPRINLTKEDLGKPLTLKVQATNDDPENNPITYQWSDDNGDIDGATSAEFTIENMTVEKAGYYRCTAKDGFSTESIGFSVNALYFLREQDTLTPQPGETVTVDMTAATVSENEITYKWQFYSSATEETVDLDHTEPTLPVTVESVNNYGAYHCEATDGIRTIYGSVMVYPPVDPGITLTDITAVPGETITITGEAKTRMINQINDYIEIWVYRYDEDGDTVDPNEIGDGTLLGFMEAEINRFKKDGYYVCEFTITIPEISKEDEGTYGLKPSSYYLDGETLKFSLSVKDYAQITLLDQNGTAIEGILHPGAQLNMRPLQNHVRNYFKQHMPDNMEIVWENDITLEIYGDADEHKGDLTLHIPVNKKYNGMKLTVLHYVNGEVEELEGMVTDGILTITTKSLSPFAVVASEETTTPPGENSGQVGSEQAPDDNGGETSAPKAGDSSMVWIYGLLILLCMAGIGGFLQKIRKNAKS